MYGPPTRTYGYGFECATTRAAPGCLPSGQHRGHNRAITYVRRHSISFFCVLNLPIPGSNIPKTETVEDPADYDY